MVKNGYTNKSLPLLERMLRIEADFESIVSEYYKKSPKEKGKETVFYREMKNMIYSFESTVENMKAELENPDLISTHDMK